MGTWLYLVEITLSVTPTAPREVQAQSIAASKFSINNTTRRQLEPAMAGSSPARAGSFPSTKAITISSAARVVKSRTMQLHIRIGVVKIAHKTYL